MDENDEDLKPPIRPPLRAARAGLTAIAKLSSMAPTRTPRTRIAGNHFSAALIFDTTVGCVDEGGEGEGEDPWAARRVRSRPCGGLLFVLDAASLGLAQSGERSLAPTAAQGTRVWRTERVRIVRNGLLVGGSVSSGEPEVFYCNPRITPHRSSQNQE